MSKLLVVSLYKDSPKSWNKKKPAEKGSTGFC